MTLEKEERLEEQEDTQHGRFLTFALGEEVFGIEIRFVKEIIGMQPVTRLPEVPNYIKGIINLRGKIIPVIDVRLKFKKEAVAYNDRTCIIVIETATISVGLIVDNVDEVIAIDDENIVPPPDERSGIQNRYISGIGKVENEVKLLLDCEKLFQEEDVKIISDIH
jgi:purine-binding chemotaxis protein CheW